MTTKLHAVADCP